jgi:hypothetical protein
VEHGGEQSGKSIEAKNKKGTSYKLSFAQDVVCCKKLLLELLSQLQMLEVKADFVGCGVSSFADSACASAMHTEAYP